MRVFRYYAACNKGIKLRSKVLCAERQYINQRTLAAAQRGSEIGHREINIFGDFSLIRAARLAKYRNCRQITFNFVFLRCVGFTELLGEGFKMGNALVIHWCYKRLWATVTVYHHAYSPRLLDTFVV